MKLFPLKHKNAQRKDAASFGKKTTLPIALILMTGLLVGCSTVGYYSQIVSGHMRIVMGKRPLAEVATDETIDDSIKRRLDLAQRARVFGIEQLSLPNNQSYTSFYDTGQDYVTWNVVAAQEFSLDPHNWCFPIAGCVSYRGYYSREDAQAYADGLAKEGLDVTVTGATAYSTLGWFEDPLLNTMLDRSDPSIASLLFHELAHQQLYVGDDSTFNESFATFVEKEGLKQWQKNEQLLNPQLDQSAMAKELDIRKRRQQQFIALLTNTRDSLVALYESSSEPDVMRQMKKQRFEQMLVEYEELKASWDGYSGYDQWFEQGLNNARLVAVATYNDYVPAFEVLFNETGSTFEDFYVAALELSKLPLEERTEEMQKLLARSSVVSQ